MAGTVQKAVKQIPWGQLKALGEEIAQSLGLTETPEIIAAALRKVTTEDPKLGSSLRGASKNPKMQLKLLEEAGALKKVRQNLAQPPRVDRQGRLEVPPAVKPTSLTTEEVPFTAPVIVSKAPRPAAAPAVTQQQPPVLPPEDLASIETPKALSLKDGVDRWSGYKEPPTEPYIPEPLPGGPSPSQWSAYGKGGTQPVSPKNLPSFESEAGKVSTGAGLKTGAKVILGTGAVATVAGLTATGQPIITDDTTGKQSTVYKPQIINGKLAVSNEEAEDIKKTYTPKPDTLRGGGYSYGTRPEQVLRARQDEYSELEDIALENTKNDWKKSLKKDYTPELESSPEFKESYNKELGRLVNEKYSVKPITQETETKASAAKESATTELTKPSEETATAQTTTPGGEETKPVTKPAGTPPPAPEGGVLAATAQPSAPAVDTTTLKEPTKEVAKSQQALPDIINSVTADRKRIADAFGGGKPVSREATKTALENIAKVDDEIKTLYANKPPPQLADVTRARRDALQAYKEKANLNEWLSIADRAINAIASFASAQAAKGTPYVGTYKPSSTDYESRTAQALREYQAEAGMLQEERQESEKALAAYEKEKETAAEQLRRSREMAYRIAQEEVKAQEETQDRADKITQDVFNANLSLIKNQQDINAAIEKYRTSQAKDDKEGQQKSAKNVLELQIKEQENAQKAAQNLLDASNALAANPNDEKAQLKYLEVTGQSAEAFEQERGKQPGGFFGRDIVRTENLGKATASNAQMILDQSKQRSAELSQNLQSLLSGGIVQPTTPTPAPAGQQPAARATVWGKGPDGKEYEYYADTKEPTGKSR